MAGEGGRGDNQRGSAPTLPSLSPSCEVTQNEDDPGDLGANFRFFFVYFGLKKTTAVVLKGIFRIASTSLIFVCCSR